MPEKFLALTRERREGTSNESHFRLARRSLLGRTIRKKRRAVKKRYYGLHARKKTLHRGGKGKGKTKKEMPLKSIGKKEKWGS